MDEPTPEEVGKKIGEHFMASKDCELRIAGFSFLCSVYEISPLGLPWKLEFKIRTKGAPTRIENDR